MNTRGHHDHVDPDNTAVVTDPQAQQALNGDEKESRQDGTANNGVGNVENKTEAKTSPASEGMGEPTLPPFASACSPDSAYLWGSLDRPAMCDKVSACFSEVIHWMRSVFKMPSEKVRKAFMSEMAKPFQAFAEENRIESFALTAAVVLPHLLLQKPRKGPSVGTKDHTLCLDRRLQSWLNSRGPHKPAVSWDMKAIRQGQR